MESGLGATHACSGNGRPSQARLSFTARCMSQFNGLFDILGMRVGVDARSRSAGLSVSSPCPQPFWFQYDLRTHRVLH
eukprot:10554500-Alexandrium_andersonii.AAC.1